MEIVSVDHIQLNFNAQNLFYMNIVIGLMMLGVSLDISRNDIVSIVDYPKALFIGLFAQFLLLPAFTFILILFLQPYPSIALGMILVSACPGGNLSNIITYLAKGNTTVSIIMTAMSSVIAIIMTPINFSIWGSLLPSTASMIKAVHLNPFDVFITIFIILGIPITVGQLILRHYPNFAERIRQPFKVLSFVFFILMIIIVLAANYHNFIQYVGVVILVVFLHNALALNIGYWSAYILRLSERDCRAIAIEVGIQNSALGLVLVFNFFNGLGGMAIVVAFWGVWHLIAGLAAALFFSCRKI